MFIKNKNNNFSHKQQQADLLLVAQFINEQNEQRMNSFLIIPE